MFASRCHNAVLRFAHPVTLIATLALFVNALILQPAWPSWWTGKLGDLAWLVVAPLLLAVVVASLTGLNTRRSGLLAVGVVGLAFVAMKTLAPVNTLVRDGYAAIAGRPAKLALDPSDLLALPGLWVAWRVWNRRVPARRHATVQVAGLLLAATALIADSPAPQEFGIICVVRQPNGLAAVSQTSQHGYFGDSVTERVFTSTDEGHTWTVAPAPSKDNPAPCQRPEHESNWSFTQNTPELHFLFLSNQGVYRTDDGGKTYTQEYATTAPINDAIEAGDGGLIVAGGPAGVLLRSPDGQWSAVAMPNP
ncbi:MAG TPA: hypothetical protein VFT99_08800 [Roseiflexaceae bacterium]|nr:hypothetical protein [Roseiflexaceae bacterium]